MERMELNLCSMMLALVLMFFYFLATCTGLECWQCIADDCHLDPASNYKAVKRNCQPEQSCQKVEYKGRDSKTKTDYTSTVRSCSQGECFNHADNCSDQLLTNPGCMVRLCCNAQSLCNAAPPSECRYTIVFYSMAFLLGLAFYPRLS